MVMTEAGLVQQFKRTYISNGRQCSNRLSSIIHRKTKVFDTLGAFLALGIGLLLATIAFVMEMLVRQILKISLKSVASWREIQTRRDLNFSGIFKKL